MNAQEQLIAYMATLAALVIALVGSMLIAAFVPGILGHVADFGIGTVTGGLIGVLRIPSTRQNPVATTDSGDVSVTTQGGAK
ncbi:hypothetical protein [Sphingomonas sp. 10B4]|uniref:hypothetical protein n=1 Tax=Sphingomonas sp. 10B4 TaxID=3048575 RepID=UPI002AB5AC93|nr:hypothetical protein [Sphingomonas sp. 10B4]MDY7525468.1 hypothetical protein [Sphingomonas sp. 10B4]MEB0281412.1 hypothetical protein [Sphingomonas sp. 10B4]